MFQVMFTNGLPAKEIILVDCCQDLENNDELQQFFKEENVEKGIKIFLLDEDDIKKTAGIFKRLHVVENKLWFDYGNKYLVCDGLDEDTKKYFLNNNKKFILASIDSKTNRVKLLAQYTLS